MLGKRRINIGIYSSANNTFVRAEDEKGNLIGTSLLEDPINICISIKHSWEIIKKAVSIALRKENILLTDPSMEFHVGIGIKNTELIEACIELKKQNNLFKTFVLEADGYVLLRGSHQKKGSIIILDNGVVGNAIKNGSMIKIGGWGFPHADKGSIPWIGLEAIRLTLQWLDGFIDDSPLIIAIYRHFNNDISKLVQWAMYSRTDPKEYGPICDIVLDFLYKQDKYSLSLISSAALEASRLYKKLLEKCGVTSMPCSLHGQLVPHIKNFIGGVLSENITAPLGDGADGAISLIKELESEKQENHFIDPINYKIRSTHSFTG